MRLTSIILSVALSAGLIGGPSGCGRGCSETMLTLEPVGRSALEGPVTLRARLTADGDPVAGAAIVFFVEVTAPTPRSGRSIGDADTSADGVAAVSVRAGLKALVLADEAVKGYSAEFRVTSSADDGDYCRTRSEARLAG